MCQIVTASNYQWTGTYTNNAGDPYPISNGILDMYASTMTGASNYMDFTEYTGGNNYVFNSSTINSTSIKTNPAAGTYSFSGTGNLCIAGSSTCTGVVPFSVSGNINTAGANDWLFSYSSGTKAATQTTGGSLSVPIGTPANCALPSGRRRLLDSFRRMLT